MWRQIEQNQYDVKCRDMLYSVHKINWWEADPISLGNYYQKQLSRGVLRERRFKNIQQIYPCRSVISIKLQGNFI